MILDTNALSAWAEGLAGVETPLRSADRLVVPSVVLKILVPTFEIRHCQLLLCAQCRSESPTYRSAYRFSPGFAPLRLPALGDGEPLPAYFPKMRSALARWLLCPIDILKTEPHKSELATWKRMHRTSIGMAFDHGRHQVQYA